MTNNNSFKLLSYGRMYLLICIDLTFLDTKEPFIFSFLDDLTWQVDGSPSDD